MKKHLVLYCLILLILCSSPLAAQPLIRIPGLQRPAQVVRDANGIPHIFAANEHDLFFMQGWVHAQDRFFQMDVARRGASGTLAELFGPAALESDVEIRTVGIRRAAARSLPLLSEPVIAALKAYSEGVNAFINANFRADSLPPEYRALELSQVKPWSPLDSLTIATFAAFQRSFDLDDIDRTLTLGQYQAAVGAIDGTALFFEDIFRSAPFPFDEPASTIPDATEPAPTAIQLQGIAQREMPPIRPETITLCRSYLERVRDIPFFRHVLRRSDRSGDSNEWVVSGQHTERGFPLLANDPHLSLDMPATFYQNHLRVRDINVIGSSFPGVPFVILGHNRFIAWGSTTNPIDVTDVFEEAVKPDPTSPSGLSIIHQGKNEPIIPLPQTFRFNQPGDGIPNNLDMAPPGGTVDGTFIPPAVLIVPRRNNGPIVELNLAEGMAFSVQFTGFSGNRVAEVFFTWNRARNLDDFIQGLQFFDFGSQNWAYADVHGNIAYFAGGKVPLREDLQDGTVTGLPPFFIRNGTGENEWLRLQPPSDQTIPLDETFEVLPFNEMPQVINPLNGYLVNANNDPGRIVNGFAESITLDNDPLNQLRTDPDRGIFYIAPGFDRGIRAQRITDMIQERLRNGGKVSFEDMKAMQADTVLRDAQEFVPFIIGAFKNANAHPILQALAEDPEVAEAVGRLSTWDFTTLTGIEEGFDASDEEGERFPPTEEEIDSSVAATIYSTWRGRMINNTIIEVLASLGLGSPGTRQEIIALGHLLKNFGENEGVGESGIDFFEIPDVEAAPEIRRDIKLLQSLKDALDLLASEEFDSVFPSTNQEDYRWGLLHRIVFEHPLEGPFNVPPASSAFPPPLLEFDLPGIPTDGGFDTVDASTHRVLANEPDDFMFDSGPNRRYVGEMALGRIRRAESSLPGGVSGVLGNPLYVNLLDSWLTNDSFPLFMSRGETRPGARSIEIFVPRGPSSP